MAPLSSRVKLLLGGAVLSACVLAAAGLRGRFFVPPLPPPEVPAGPAPFSQPPAQGGTRLPSSEPSRNPAAPGFTLTDLKGDKVSLSDFKGRPVFMDFWATWCGPCRVSMPEVEKLHRDYAARGLQVLGMNVDEDPAAAAMFARHLGVGYPTLLVGGSGVDAHYGISGIPAFFLIDKDGGVAGAWVGFDGRYPSLWRRKIDELLGR